MKHDHDVDLDWANDHETYNKQWNDHDHDNDYDQQT